MRKLFFALALFAAVAAAMRLRRPAPEPAPPPVEAVTSEHELDSLSRDELYERAKERDIPGRSKMSKGELRNALNNGHG